MPDDDGGPAWPDGLVQAYQSHRLSLVRLAYLLTGDREASEEVVQEAFLATRRSWERVRDVRPYVRAAVVNGSRSWLRRRQLERRHPAPPPEPASLGADELWDALEHLTPRHRAALVLRYYEGLPDVEIASILGCRQPTVRTTIHRALGALRREIER